MRYAAVFSVSVKTWPRNLRSEVRLIRRRREISLLLSPFWRARRRAGAYFTTVGGPPVRSAFLGDLDRGADAGKRQRRPWSSALAAMQPGMTTPTRANSLPMHNRPMRSRRRSPPARLP